MRGIKPSAGSGPIRIALWPSARQFMKQGEWTRAVSVPAEDFEHAVEFHDLPLGRYAVSAFHDVTNCGSFRRDALGLPRDPWAVSGGGPGWLPPSWRRASFELTAEGASVELEFSMGGAAGKREAAVKDAASGSPMPPGGADR